MRSAKECGIAYPKYPVLNSCAVVSKNPVKQLGRVKVRFKMLKCRT